METQKTQQNQPSQAFLEGKSEYLQQLLTITDNKTYVKHVLSHPFLQNLNEYLTENQESSLEQIKAKILEFSDRERNAGVKEYSELIEILYSIYIREAVTGPSVYTLYVAETKAPLIKGGPLPDTEMDQLSNKNQQLQEKLLAHFEKDSEQVYLKTQFLVIFYAIEVLLDQENVPEKFREESLQMFQELVLWRARFYYLHDQQLTSSVVHLKDKSLKYYESYINEFEQYYQSQAAVSSDDVRNSLKKKYVNLLIEQSYCYLNFYKYKHSKTCIKKAMTILNLNLKLTGRLGRRTKYQEFDIAQLVLDVDNREVQIIEAPQVEESKVQSQVKKSAYGDVDGVGMQLAGSDEVGMEEERKEQNVKLEEDTILYETPKITDPLGDFQKRILSPEDQLVIQAYVNYVTKTHPKDETRMELLRPYINTCLENSSNWLVYSTALLQRSRNEMERTKTTERALLQLQTLIDQYRDKEPSLGVRIQYYFASGYPLLWHLQKELARSYQKIGVYVSRPTLAEELANERLQKSPIAQPGILCLLGDIKKDVSYYEKAWEVSNHKFARAMRSMARIQYFQGEYVKCAESYEKALAISRLYPDAWFTLGCAYMRLEDFKQSIFAFGTSVSIDESNCEAWCNISTCQMRLDRYKEAVMCLEQALKHNRKNWKIWENYIILSIETMQFYKAVSAARELMRVDMTERLNVNLMLKICDVFLKNYIARGDVKPEEYQVAKRQLYSFFDEYTEKVAKDWQVWRLIGRIKGILKEGHEVVKDLKLKEIRALMNINWENNIEQCEKVERSLDEFLKMKASGVITNEEKVFARNTVQTIEQCTQRKSTVAID
eukprot:403357539